MQRFKNLPFSLRRKQPGALSDADIDALDVIRFENVKFGVRRELSFLRRYFEVEDSSDGLVVFRSVLVVVGCFPVCKRSRLSRGGARKRHVAVRAVAKARAYGFWVSVACLKTDE